MMMCCLIKVFAMALKDLFGTIELPVLRDCVVELGELLKEILLFAA